MKCVKSIFKDILFFAPNGSDEQGTSYGRFSGFLGPLGCSEEKFKCLGGFLESFRCDFRCKSMKIYCFVTKIQHCALMTVFRVLVLYTHILKHRDINKEP